MNIRRSLVSTGLLACAAIFQASCGKEPEYGPVVPIRGKVVWNSQPAAGALITLHPLDATAQAPLKPNAEVAADGSFQIGTYLTADGAPPGKYAVTISWPVPGKPLEGAGPDRLQGRYSNPQQPAWTVEVKEEPVDVGQYVLK